MQKELNYLYISGSIRVLETKILSEGDFDKLIGAESDAELLRLLSGYGYDLCGKNEKDAHFEDAIVSAARRTLFEMLKKDCPNSEYFSLFLYPNDYLNLKVLVKKTAKADAAATLSGDGTVAVLELEKAVKGLAAEGLTAKMREGIEKAKSEYANTLDPQSVDIVLDRCCFEDMLASANASGERFLIDYVKLLIDVANVKAYFRLKKMGRDKDFASRIFFDGGNLAGDFYAESFALSTEEFAEKARKTPVAALVSTALAHVESFGGRGKMERAFDGEIMTFARKAKYAPYGADVVAAYLIAKETEFKNIRIICAARRAGVSAEEIKERLRLSYV